MFDKKATEEMIEGMMKDKVINDRADRLFSGKETITLTKKEFILMMATTVARTTAEVTNTLEKLNQTEGE